jgi:hypothetical protein
VLNLLSENNSADPVLAIKQAATDLVSRAFDSGWQGPPFSPIKLAELEGIDILPNDATLEARTIPIGKNKFRIEYNPGVRPSRINFSIAHEIAHTLFSDCAESVRHRMPEKDPYSWELEFLCDIAAAEILLPYGVFALDAKAVLPSTQNLLALADKYNASFEAVLLRYVEVVQRPCAIVVAAFDSGSAGKLRVIYSKSSYGFDRTIHNGYVVPHGSKAYECVNPGWSSKGVEEWSAFNGLKCEMHCIGLPAIKHDPRLRVGCLLVPIDKKEIIQENAIDYRSGDATMPQGEGTKIIGQIVNNGAALGFGFGRAMAKNWPESARALRKWKEDHATFRLGMSKLTNLTADISVFQMLAQKGVTPNERSIGLKYAALRQCLSELRKVASDQRASVHIPRIGAGQAGGEWSIIEGIITEELINRGIIVSVYDLPGSRPRQKKSTAISLFEQSG